MSKPARKSSRPPVKALHKVHTVSIKDGKKVVHEELVTHRADGTIFVKFFHQEGTKREKVSLNQKSDGSYMVTHDGKQKEMSKDDAMKLMKSKKALEFALKFMKSQKLARARKRKAGPGSRSRKRSRKSRKGSKRKRSRKASKKSRKSRKRRSRKRR